MSFWQWPFKIDNSLLHYRQLDQIGLRNELLRHQIEGIEHDLRQVEAFKKSFKGIVAPISGALEELESTRAELQEMQGKFVVASETLDEVRSQYAIQSEELEALSGRHDALTQKNGELERKVNLLDFALAESTASARQRADELDVALTQIRVEIRRSEEAAAELAIVKEELGEKYKAAAQFEQALTIASDQNRLLLQALESLKHADEGHVEQIGRLVRRESDLEELLKEAQTQITGLRAERAQHDIIHGMAKLKHEEENDRLKAEVAAIANHFEAGEARCEVLQRLLDEAREQLGAKVDAARGLEQKLHDQTLRANFHEKKLASLEDDLKDANAKLSQSEGAQQTLIERSKTLVRSMEAKTAAVEKAESRIHYLNSRIEEFGKRQQDQRSQFEAKVFRLTEELEKQRAERSMAEGALQASRRTRLQSIEGESAAKTPETARAKELIQRPWDGADADDPAPASPIGLKRTSGSSELKGEAATSRRAGSLSNRPSNS